MPSLCGETRPMSLPLTYLLNDFMKVVELWLLTERKQTQVQSRVLNDQTLEHVYMQVDIGGVEQHHNGMQHA